MYCQKCGSEISEGAKFCPACGALNESAEPTVKKDLILGRFTRNQIVGMVAVVAVVIILFVVLGKVFGGNSLVGKWTLDHYVEDGITESVDEDVFIDFKDDGTCILYEDGSTINGTYTQDKKTVTIAYQGTSMVFKFENNELSMTGGSKVIYFKK